MRKSTKKQIIMLGLTILGIAVIPAAAWAQTCTPRSVPYLEDFNGVVVPAFPACTQVENLDGNPTTWVTSSWMGNALSIAEPDNDVVSDDWFYTEGIRLDKDTIYKLEFGYTGLGAKGGKGEGIASMDVSIGSEKRADSMSVNPVLYEDIDFVLNLNTLDTVTVYFKPARTGVWYLGFHSKMEGKAEMRVDDISVMKAHSNYWKDVSTVSITDPPASAGICPDNNAAVRVAVTNTGIDTLVNIPVHLSIGGNVMNQTINGNLAPLESDTVVFSAVDLSVPGPVTLKAYSGLPADEFAGNDSVEQNLVVVLPPVVDSISVTAEGGLVYRFSANVARDVNTYEWDFGDGQTGTGSNPAHTYASEGNFAVSLKGSNGCDWDTVSYVFEILEVENGVTDMQMKGNGPLIYPNPVRGRMIIRSGNDDLLREIVIYNSTGSVVYQSGSVSAPELEIQTASWSAGIYLVRIHTNEGDVLRRAELAP